MQVTVSRISPVVLELSVEIPADAVKAEVDKAYSTLARKAHVKGFRPGKAPRNILTQIYGPQVANDVANALVNESLPKVLTEKTLTPVSQPNVFEAGKIDAKAAFAYKARFEVQPDIEEVKFEGFELTRPPLTVTDAMVDEQLEGLRQRQAAHKVPEPARASQKNDIVTIDFTLSIDGTEVKDGGGQGIELELGAGQALPELDAALTGKNVGDELDTDVAFSATHPRVDFQNKTGKFHSTVKEIKEKVLPAIDDELAKDIGQFETLVELRADIHTKLEKMMKDRAETALAEQIVAKLNENNPLDVPPSLVQQQARMMEEEINQQARRMGQRITREQAQALRNSVFADAEKKVRAGLLMAAIARKHEFKITDEDIERGLTELSDETGKNVAKLRAEYRDPQKRDILVGMLLEDKILDFVESKSTIKDGPDPSALPAPTPEAAASEASEAK